MQKWEYLVVNFFGNKDEAHPRFVNDEELKDWKNGPKLSQFCNERGEEGWEMVSMAITSNHFGEVLESRAVFKRPKGGK